MQQEASRARVARLRRWYSARANREAAELEEGEAMSKIRKMALTLSAAVVGLLSAAHVQAQDIDTAIAPAVAQVNEKYSEHSLDIKKLFATKCSWCHQGYGMRQADGPKLAGSDKNHAQLMKQIANGKSPMPGFKNQLKPYEIEALADYIKLLPAN
jgi:mono/diheme cytochrome c family protein